MSTMDRPLEQRVLDRRMARKILITAGLVLAALGLLAVTRYLLGPRLKRQQLYTAVTDKGRISETLTATGTIVPLSEHVVSSPIDSRVLQVLLEPGAQVIKGQAILALDLAEIQLMRDRVAKQIAEKEGQMEESRLQQAATRIDLEGKRDLQQVDLEALDTKMARLEKLFGQGLISQEEVAETQVAIKKARILVTQTGQALNNLIADGSQKQKALALDLELLQKEKERLDETQALATARAETDGVLTFVMQEKGAVVHKGDILARITKLDAFRVEATLPDTYIPHLAQGMTATVRARGLELAASLQKILPAIEDGTARMVLDLAEPAAAGLRPQLRVEVEVETDAIEDAVRIKAGPFANGSGHQQVFVIQDGQAIRRKVELGTKGSHHFEVISGLRPGDEVIISDMRDFSHFASIPIHN